MNFTIISWIWNKYSISELIKSSMNKICMLHIVNKTIHSRNIMNILKILNHILTRQIIKIVHIYMHSSTCIGKIWTLILIVHYLWSYLLDKKTNFEALKLLFCFIWKFKQIQSSRFKQTTFRRVKKWSLLETIFAGGGDKLQMFVLGIILPGGLHSQVISSASWNIHVFCYPYSKTWLWWTQL